jgi:hypothetical protein
MFAARAVSDIIVVVGAFHDCLPLFSLHRTSGISRTILKKCIKSSFAHRIPLPGEFHPLALLLRLRLTGSYISFCAGSGDSMPYYNGKAKGS